MGAQGKYTIANFELRAEVVAAQLTRGKDWDIVQLKASTSKLAGLVVHSTRVPCPDPCGCGGRWIIKVTGDQDPNGLRWLRIVHPEPARGDNLNRLASALERIAWGILTRIAPEVRLEVRDPVILIPAVEIESQVDLHMTEQAVKLSIRGENQHLADCIRNKHQLSPKPGGKAGLRIGCDFCLVMFKITVVMAA